MATNQLVDIKKKITEEFLQCCVCMHESVSTRRLPCRHNFCLKCLEKIAGGGNEFPCPICRVTVKVPEGGFDQFPEDVPTKKMLDFVNGLHMAGNRSFFCEHHPNKLLDLYCKTDNTLICGTCVVKQHKGHDAETIEDAAQERKGCFQRMTDAQDKTLHDIQTEISELEKMKRKVKTETQCQIADVNKKAKILQTAIETRRHMLQNVIEKIHSKELYEIEEAEKNLREQEDEVKAKKQRYVHVLKQPTAVEMMFCAHSVEHLKPSDIKVPISTKDVTRITLSETDVETLVEKLFGQLKIEKKLTAKLKTVETIKTSHTKHDEIKRIVASGNKIYVLSQGGLEVFSEQNEPATVIDGFHNPVDMAVLQNGNILAIDEGCVKVFDNLVGEVSTMIVYCELINPCSIAVDGKSLIYVGQSKRDFKVFETAGTGYRRMFLKLKYISTLCHIKTTNYNHIYINQSNGNIYCFNTEFLDVFGPNGNKLQNTRVGRFAKDRMQKIRDVAADIYGNTLITVAEESNSTGEKLFVLDKDMETKHTFELPCQGHIAVNSNGYLVHGTKDGQIVLYKYTG